MEDAITAEELLLEIFSYLDIVDLKNARLVCRRWNRISLDFTLPLEKSLSRDAELRRVLDISSSPYLPPEIIPEGKTGFDLDKYALRRYLIKNGRKEVIGNRYGDIIQKYRIYAFRMGHKRIKFKEREGFHYRVAKLSWVLIRRWQLHYSQELEQTHRGWNTQEQNLEE